MQWLNGICGSIYDAQVKEDVPAGLRSHVFVFRVMCFWPMAEDPRWYKWLTTSLYLSIGVLFPLSLCVNIFFVTSVQEAMDHIFLSVAFSTTGFKMGIIYWQLDNIRELFRIHAELLRGAWRNAVNHSRTARLNLRIHMLFTLMYGSTAVGFLLQVAFSRPEDSVYTSTLLYPFDFMHSRAIYSTVLVYQCVGNMCSGIWAALTFTFLSALMNIACGHLADLKDRLRNLGTAKDTSMFYKDLIDCCKCYGMCLRCVFSVWTSLEWSWIVTFTLSDRFTDIMTNILSPSYFAQFVVSGGVLCCTVYLLSVVIPCLNHSIFFCVDRWIDCLFSV